MNPLNVLVLSRKFRGGGGVANFVSMLVNHPVELVRWTHFQIGDPNRQRHDLFKAARPVIDIARLLARLRRRDIDCLYINPSMNWRAFARDGLLLMAAQAAGQRNTVVFFHGWDASFAKTVNRRPVYRFLLNRVYGTASAVIVLAGDFKKQLTKLGLDPDRIFVTTTMFDGSIFKGITVQKDLQRPRLLFLSRFIKEKGVFELLEALPRILERFPDVELVLAGDGPARSEMEEYVRSHALSASVQFTGYLTGTRKAEVLKSSALFVFPTRHPEGCPVSLLEAMAAGLPIVTTLVGGISEIFSDRTNGILLNTASPNEIADAVIRLLADPEWRKQIGDRNEDIAWRAYECGIVSQRIADICKQTAV